MGFLVSDPNCRKRGFANSVLGMEDVAPYTTFYWTKIFECPQASLCQRCYPSALKERVYYIFQTKTSPTRQSSMIRKSSGVSPNPNSLPQNPLGSRALGGIAIREQISTPNMRSFGAVHQNWKHVNPP